MARSTRIWLALGTVYVVWGSTYLAIMLGIRTLPPFLMSATRFAFAGALLYGWAIRRDGERPSARQWFSASIVGALLLVAANGGLAWAEHRVDTGLAALIVACVPIWIALLEWIVFRRRLSASGLLGLLVGLAGVGFLVGPSGEVDPLGGAVIVGGSLAWAAGSLYAPRAVLPSSPLTAAGMQMLAAAVLNTVVGVSMGELGQLQTPSFESLAGLAYLIVIGSIVTYSAYLWLLANASASLVSTYAYVNPVIAVALGAVFLGEAVTATMLLAGGLIVAAVVLIVTAKTRSAPARREPLPEPEPVLERAA